MTIMLLLALDAGEDEAAVELCLHDNNLTVRGRPRQEETAVSRTIVTENGMTPEELGMRAKVISEDDDDLRNYLLMREAALHYAREHKKGGTPGGGLKARLFGNVQECWSAIEAARVISCGSAIRDVVTHCDHYLRRVFGKRWGEGVHQDPEFVENDLVDFARCTVPYPEKLPFPSTYLSFGGGLIGYDLETEKSDVLLGFLLTTKAAWQFYAQPRSDGNAVLPVTLYSGNQWSDYSTKSPWCAVQLVDLINSYHMYIEEVPRTLKSKMDYEKLGKGYGFKKAIPPPYYRVKLQDVHIRERLEQGFHTTRELSYRHDRRGHECCRFRRGKLPMDSKIEMELRDCGYELFKQNPVDVNTFRRLSLRGLPYKAHDEWLAVKTYWVRDCVVGDESLPYVPSIHVVPEVGTKKESE